MSCVAHLVDSASRRAGGIFESVRGFSRAVIEGGRWRPTVIAPSDPDCEQDARLWGPTRVRLMNSYVWSREPISGRLARAAAAEGAAVAHVHGVWGVGARAGALLKWRHPEIKLVVSPHGMVDQWALAHSRWRKAVAWQVWAGRLLTRADYLHALTEVEAEAIAVLAPGRPIAVVPNGVDVPILGDTDQVSRERIVLFLGRIHPKKGISLLVEAWSKLQTARGQGWQLVIAGWDDGGHEAALEAQSKHLRLGDSVTFLGPVFGDAKDHLLRSAGAFALPSFSEGLPMAVLEAWSYGLPVLMTDECNLPEGFKAGAAVHVDPTPDSVAAGLTRLVECMTEDERRGMGRRGRTLIKERFTWAQAGAEMSSVYDQFVDSETTTNDEKVSNGPATV